MSVNSRNKRFSLIGLGIPIPSVLPNPSGSFDARDRAQLEFLYAGSLVYLRRLAEVLNIQPSPSYTLEIQPSPDEVLEI